METLCSTNSGWFIHQGQSTIWTKEENKMFESALAIYDEKTPNRWYKVASMIPGKSVYDVINQYRELVEDVSDIEAGLVPIPGYLASSFTLESENRNRSFAVISKKRGRACDQERKKGVPWTEDEHRRFLQGLQKHGKGDWRNISRNFVITKTPTQVASHAQKYYLRQISGGKDKRRPSIHDITTVHQTDDTSQTHNKKFPDDFLDKCDELMMSVQKTSSAPKILVDWSIPNDASLTVFDSGFGDSLVASYPRDIATTRGRIYNIGAYGHSQKSRFHI